MRYAEDFARKMAWVKAGSFYERALVLLRKGKNAHLVGRNLLAGMVVETKELADQLEMAERRIAYLESQQTPDQVERDMELVARMIREASDARHPLPGFEEPTAEEAEALHEASGMGDGCGTFRPIGIDPAFDSERLADRPAPPVTLEDLECCADLMLRGPAR